MTSPIRFQDFSRRFRAYGVTVTKIAKSSHVKMEKIIEGKLVLFYVTVHKKKVDAVYMHKARRRFRLTRDCGVTDSDFNSK